jgi:predicted small lipoprotein YifL
MIKINQKLKWLLMVLPLAGCATSVPLDMPKEATTPMHTSTQTTVKVKSVIQPPVDGVSEVRTVIERKETEVRTGKVGTQPPINPLDRPGDPTALAQPKNVVSRPVNIDPNVQLIAPPVGLPKTAYVVPQVEEKETYVAPAPVVKTKVITSTCKTGKKGKTICKMRTKNEITEVKSKKDTSVKKDAKVGKSTKDTSKTTAKSVSKKTTDSSKKKAVVKDKKKDSKK